MKFWVAMLQYELKNKRAVGRGNFEAASAGRDQSNYLVQCRLVDGARGAAASPKLLPGCGLDGQQPYF